MDEVVYFNYNNERGIRLGGFPSYVMSLALPRTVVSWLFCATLLSVMSIARVPGCQSPAEGLSLEEQILRSNSIREAQKLLAESPHQIDQKLKSSLIEKAKASLKSTGDRERSVYLFNVAESICVYLKDETNQALMLQQLGKIRYDAGNYESAIDHYSKSGLILERLGHEERLARNSTSLSIAYTAKGDLDEGINHARKSIAISEKLSDRMGKAQALLIWGRINVRQGAYSDALVRFEQSLALCYELKLRNRAVDVLSEIGWVHRVRDDYKQAFYYYGQALKISDETSYKGKKSDILSSLAILNEDQGDREAMFGYLSKSLEFAREQNDQSAAADALLNLGIYYREQGDHLKAIEQLQQCLTIATETNSIKTKINAHNAIGSVYLSVKELDLARKYFDTSIDLAVKSGDEPLRAVVLWNKAKLDLSAGKTAQAVQLADEAANLADRMGLNNLVHLALAAKGRAYYEQKDYAAAERCFREAIARIETIRQNVAGRERERQLFFENKVEPYQYMVELMTRRGETFEALSYAERAKGRALLDSLRLSRNQNVSNNQYGVDNGRNEPRQNNSSSLSGKEHFLGEASKNNAAVSNTEQEREQPTEPGHDSSVSLLAIGASWSKDDVPLHTLSIKELSSFLDDKTTLILEFVVKRDKTFLFVVEKPENAFTKTTTIQDVNVAVYVIPLSADQLNRRVESFRQSVSEGNLGYRRASRGLYDLLLAPASRHFRGKKLITIVPDGVLWVLPFQALLTDSDHYLLEEHAIHYVPSLSVLTAMQQKRPAQLFGGAKGQRAAHGAFAVPGKTSSGNAESVLTRLLAIGDPRMPSNITLQSHDGKGSYDRRSLQTAANEVKEVNSIYSKVYPTKALTGDQATEVNFKSLAGKARVIHIATHGVLNDKSPLNSYLVLSGDSGGDDGRLEANEILSMHLDADLVVLSACETARGRFGAGEGVIGMSWALFVAGCPTAVVSQWKVDAASTRDLMVSFHSRIASEGAHKGVGGTAEALRQAAMKLLRTDQYKHPAYWAGFVVIGHGK